MLNQPMSSPMMKTMFGGASCAKAGAASARPEAIAPRSPQSTRGVTRDVPVASPSPVAGFSWAVPRCWQCVESASVSSFTRASGGAAPGSSLRAGATPNGAGPAPALSPADYRSLWPRRQLDCASHLPAAWERPALASRASSGEDGVSAPASRRRRGGWRRGRSRTPARRGRPRRRRCRRRRPSGRRGCGRGWRGCGRGRRAAPRCCWSRYSRARWR